MKEFVGKAYYRLLPQYLHPQTVKESLRLWSLQRRKSHLPRYVPTTEKVLGYIIRSVDYPSFYSQYKDIFIRRIYHFDSDKPDPLIIDCGSYIGMSIIYFKHIYPQARIIGFEPDSEIFKVLEENIARNGLGSVTLVNAALSSEEGKTTFIPDGSDGGRLVQYDLARDTSYPPIQVKKARLSNYLTEPVDFLKVNIEGAEYDVLREAGDRLRLVRQLVIEYHGFPDLPQRLHNILGLLDDYGFKYLTGCPGNESNPGGHSPFQLNDEVRYFVWVYAKHTE